MTNKNRPNPDELLANLKKEEGQQKHGTLKVFLGMCAGVGKTYAMLEAAQKARRQGRDVVIGYVETHGRKETDALTDGIETIPRKPVVHRGVALTEMDLDALLVRRPQLALVDELAHTNAPGSRHLKRYQDVQELLASGIDVYTTINVQHIESRTDSVREVTGIAIAETVPDTILTDAEIELVDLSPEDLLQRLAEGKVYFPERAEAASRNFFKEGHLIALREMALRLAADKVGQDVRDYMQAKQIIGPWRLGHRLQVAISSSPHSEQLVRWTKRQADALGCTWIAAYVETSHVLSEQEQNLLTSHLTLARTLGAEIRSTTDEDIVMGLLRIAKTQNVTELVVGKPSEMRPFASLKYKLFVNRLVRESGNIGIHIVRIEGGKETRRFPALRMPVTSDLWQYLQAIGTVVAITILNIGLNLIIGPRSTSLVYLMTVVILALFFNRGPVYAAATLSAFLWNYLFLEPRFTFSIASIDDLMMFAMYFIVALAMGHLISRIRIKERTDRRREERATATYMLTLELGDASTWKEIETATVNNVERSFKSEAMLILPDASGKLRGMLPDKEFSAAVWTYEHNKPAGQFTDTLPMMEAMYLPVQTAGKVLGVLRISWRQKSPPTIEQRNMLDGFLRHIALVIDRQRLRDAKAQAEVLAESERLSHALLDAVSHELKTPIAAIETAASGLRAGLEPKVQNALAEEIRMAVRRLNRLVVNLLDMARLESGHVKPRMEWCDINDIYNATLKRVAREMADRHVEIRIPQNFPLVFVDARLIEQALVDLLHNVVMHTKAGTPVDIIASKEEQRVSITVADHGPGLSDEAIPHIFDKFYRAPGAAAGGTGLGLSIVKGFVEAHGGSVRAANRPSGGAAFTLTIPQKESLVNEYGKQE